MASWTIYKDLYVPDSTVGDAGGHLKDDLMDLADRAPFISTSNPTTSDDSADGFVAGSLWLNTSTQTTWMCTSASAGAAKWRSLFKRTDNALVLAPTAAVGGSDYRALQEGLSTSVGGPGAHAEGNFGNAAAPYSHAEGNGLASGWYSHAQSHGTASGAAAHAEGGSCTASAYYSHAGGVRSKARLRSQWARSSGGHSNQLGTSQTTITQLFRLTTDGTATELTLDGGSPSGSTRFIIADGQTLSGFVNVVGRKIDGGANDHASFLRQVCIRREGSTTQLVGSVQSIGDINPSSWAVSITADDTNESLKIDVTGAASTNVRWMATIIASEVADAAI